MMIKFQNIHNKNNFNFICNNWSKLAVLYYNSLDLYLAYPLNIKRDIWISSRYSTNHSKELRDI